MKEQKPKGLSYQPSSYSSKAGKLGLNPGQCDHHDLTRTQDHVHRPKGVWAGQGRDEGPWELARAPARWAGLAEKKPHSWSVQCVPVISALLVVRLGSGASHVCAPEGSQI